MSKQRPHIPPPVITPPASAAVVQQQATQLPAIQAASAASLAVVRAPARIGSFEIKADRIEWTDPTIDLPENVWLKHAVPHRQTRRLEPHKAIVAHGLLIVEEYGIALPISGVEIRTEIKES